MFHMNTEGCCDGRIVLDVNQTFLICSKWEIIAKVQHHILTEKIQGQSCYLLRRLSILLLGIPNSRKSKKRSVFLNRIFRYPIFQKTQYNLTIKPEVSVDLFGSLLLCPVWTDQYQTSQEGCGGSRKKPHGTISMATIMLS